MALTQDKSILILFKLIRNPRNSIILVLKTYFLEFVKAYMYIAF